MNSAASARAEIEAFVLELARREGAADPRPEDRLSDLGIDSVTLAEHMGELERRFRVRMDADIADVDTIEGLVDYIAERR